MNMGLCISVKNKQDHKKVITFLCLLVLLFNMFSFSSYADASYADIPISAYDYDSVIANGLNYGTQTNVTPNREYYAVTNEFNVFMFAVGVTKYAACPVDTAVVYYAYSPNSSTVSSANVNFYNYFETYGLYYATIGGASPNGNIPSYSSLEEGLAATAQHIEDIQVWSGSASVTVNAGCVAYILVDGGIANLTCTFPELSKLSRPLWVSGATYSYSNDLPSTGTVFNSTSGTLIDWLKPASANTDLLGRTHNGGRQLSNLPTGQYLVVYNPFYRGYDSNGVGIVSPSINVSLSNYVAVRQFRLTASYNGGEIESYSEDGFTSWFDSIGQEELNADGTPSYTEHLANGTTQTAINVPSGGNIVTVQDEDTTIGGLIQRIVDFLSAPIKHIQNLFNSGVTFFNYLTSLFSWIPSEVTSVLVSALIVLLVVGVIKVLWK